ncbi:MAG TPA: hypothetical protein VFS00_19730 [Polyangiaceae bacterium]|nr:hypothetical protein [Polyangiaceae bacterium]
MKTSLDHLPEFKRDQLADVVAAIREHGPLEMLKPRARRPARAVAPRRAPRPRETGMTAFGLIVHDIKDVNQQLEKGSFFFADLKRLSAAWPRRRCRSAHHRRGASSSRPHAACKNAGRVVAGGLLLRTRRE